MRRVSVVAVLLSLMVVTILGGWLVVYSFGSIPSQEVVSQGFWIPDGAEIYSRKEVEPGTFKIRKKFEEFQATTKPGHRVVVVYTISGYGVDVEYFKARLDGIFDYTSTFIPKPISDTLFTAWSAQVNEEQATFQYTAEKNIWGFLFGTVAFAIGGTLCVSLTRRWCRTILPRRERNPAVSS